MTQDTDISALMADIGARAKAAAAVLATATAERKHAALISAADAVWAGRAQIFAANDQDMAYGADKGLTPAMLDRLKLDEDRLRVERGYLFYSDTVVPLGPVQHIDVDQGPIMRRYDLATLTVHTAGNHGASVSLPGLRHDDAVAMREAIREYIKVAQG